MSTSLPIYTVDSFSKRPFSGNPAGVCLCLNEKLDEETYKKIAAEMRHSETAFVTSHPEYSKDNPIFGLRWFTPTTEVNLCGHATLATAHVLFNDAKLVEGDLVIFETRSGLLKVKKHSYGLELDFPRGFPNKVELSHEIQQKLLSAFELSSNSIIETAFCEKTKKLIIELADFSHLQAAKVPVPERLIDIDYGMDVRGIVLACKARSSEDNKQPEYDFCTRYFSPWNGIPEDPVNGSSHTILPHYFGPKLNKTELKSYAASPRGGQLHVSLRVETPDRVFIAGNACTVLSGTIYI